MSGAAVADATIPRSNIAAGSGTLRVVRHGRRSVVSRALAAARFGSSRHGITETPPGSSHAPTAAAWLAEMLFAFRLMSKTRRRFFSTQASTKVYRSPEARLPASSRRRGPGGSWCFRILTVCFAERRSGRRKRSTCSAVDARADGLDDLGTPCVGRAVGLRSIRQPLDDPLRRTCGGARCAVAQPDDGPLAERMGRFDASVRSCWLAARDGCMRHPPADIAGIEARRRARPPDCGRTARSARRGRLRDSHGRHVGRSTSGRAARTWCAFRPGSPR